MAFTSSAHVESTTGTMPTSRPERGATLGGGDQSLAAVRKEHVLKVFAACNGNRTDAARVLGIDRKTLYRALLRWGVSGVTDEP
jgi:transcriptional regulator of acetoin/glycerol metabolism